MRIGIDNISPGESTCKTALGGMRHFMQSIVTHLPKLGASHEFELFTPSWADAFDSAHATNLHVRTQYGVPRNRIGRVFYEQVRLPREIEQTKISVWLGTCNVLPLRANCRSVLIVQSAQYLSIPEAYGWMRRQYLTRMLRQSVRRADATIVFSQASKNELAARLDLDGDRIHVVPHALRFAVDAVPDAASPREPFILSVSAFYRYKNLERLIAAFAPIARDFDVQLVFAGSPTKELTVSDLENVARDHGVEDRVRFLGRVSDDELVGLYRSATMMVMPSLEETFGFPVLEAMAFGCPVVTSNLSSMPEVAGEAAVLINPHEVASIEQGIRSVLSDSSLRSRLSVNGHRRAQQFTLDRFFTTLLSVIESVGA